MTHIPVNTVRTAVMTVANVFLTPEQAERVRDIIVQGARDEAEPQHAGLLTQRLARVEVGETAAAAWRHVVALEASDERMRQRVTELEARVDRLIQRRNYAA